ncbi:allantoinase [Peptoclostridium litorale DSM 5388]|uniref:allantoinase n=1 Tax=Peptoclostridium litorale DSM 5388 TaxID=1121324 RepID=A0A069RQ50_PEPLI|nr:allantoinase AllB [Peptoclostridium litorale]KDR96307.1 allantoinase AllB [Peptoclostridium litorale DSM 5388]SIO26101.1 allantoinase [Peptoclostridium litorale DSM 5388]
MLDLLIKNGRLVEKDRIYEANIGIKDGKFEVITNPERMLEAAETVDARGNYVFPGIIDCHAHINEPGFTWREDFETGTRAAAVGGTTTLIDMPLNNEPPLTDTDTFERKQELASKKAVVDYSFWGGLVNDNLKDLEPLAQKGVAAFKAFVCPMGESVFTSVNMGQVQEALKILKPQQVISGFHCEEYGIIQENVARAKAEGKNSVRDFLNAHSVLSEYIAAKNIIDISRETGGRVHICHVSHPSVAQIVKDAIHEGLNVTAETCPHYLGFTEDLVIEKGAPAKCTPPLRTKESAEKLWDYVLDGTLSCIGSDHSPADEKEKSNEINTIWTAWGGLNAIQFLLPMMFDMAVHKRGYSPTLLNRTLCYNPAKLFKLYGRKGAFGIGFDADVVIVDPDREWEITKESLMTKNKVSAFEGVKGRGCPTHTFVRGKLVAENGMYKDMFGHGEYIYPVREGVE